MTSVRGSTGSSAAIVAIAYLLPHSREPFTIALMLDPGRTVAELRELQELTGDENGAQRVAWTDTWQRAREWLRGRLDGTGAEETIDAAGNQWFTLPGESDRALRRGSGYGARREERARDRRGVPRAPHRARPGPRVDGPPARGRARDLRRRAVSGHVPRPGGPRGLDADGQAPRRAGRGREARARDSRDRQADRRGRCVHDGGRRHEAGHRHLGRRDRRVPARSAASRCGEAGGDAGQREGRRATFRAGGGPRGRMGADLEHRADPLRRAADRARRPVDHGDRRLVAPPAERPAP